MKPCQIAVGLTECVHTETTPLAAFFVAELFGRDDFSKSQKPKNLRYDRGCGLAPNIRNMIKENEMPQSYEDCKLNNNLKNHSPLS